MSYVITDGTRYCHRTKTRAVEIVTDLDSATRFANKSMAENILQRATKKLKGFELKEIDAEEGAKKEGAKSTARRGRKGQSAAKSEEPAAEEIRKEPENQEVKAGPESQDGQESQETPKQEKHTRRRGRRSKSQAVAAAETAEESKASGQAQGEAAAEVKEEAKSSPEPAVSVLPPSFKMEVHSASEAREQDGKGKKGTSAGGRRAAAQSKAEDAAEEAVVQMQEQAETEKAETEKTGRRSRGSRRGRRGGRGGQDHPEVRAESPEETAGQAETPAPAGAAAARPEKPAEEKMAEDKAENVIPMFTIQTHHVSENAVAKPVKSSRTAGSAAGKEQPVQTEETKEAPEKPAEEKAQGTSRSRRGRVGRNSGEHVEEAAVNAADIHEEESAPRESAGRGRGRRSQNQEIRHQDIFESETGKDSQDKNSGRRGSAQRTEKAEKSDAAPKAERGSRSRGRGAKVSATEAKRRIFTQQERYEIYNRTEGHCGICGRFIPLGEYTIDHIIPLSKGGTNDLDNLQACCSFCNKAKDDSVGDEFFQRIENIFLYQTQLKYGKKKLKKLKKTLEEFREE